MAKSNKNRYGIFYKSHGKWTGPYAGATFTAYTVNCKSFTNDITFLRRLLKSPVEVRSVKVSK